MINEPERSSDPADQQAEAAESPATATPEEASVPGDERSPQEGEAAAENPSPPQDEGESESAEAVDEKSAGDAEETSEEELEAAEDAANEAALADDEDAEFEDVEPLELLEEEVEEERPPAQWYILKVQVNREDSIRDALERRVKVAGLEEFFEDIIVPTEDVAEFTKSGKRRVVKKKLYPGYIMVNMVINDDTWFLVRETPGIGDFTGSAGNPTPMEASEVERILKTKDDSDEEEAPIRTAIPFKIGDRVRVKEGNFQNFEGEVENLDEANGRVTVMINIFGRSTPVELEHWHVEPV